MQGEAKHRTRGGKMLLTSGMLASFSGQGHCKVVYRCVNAGSLCLQ